MNPTGYHRGAAGFSSPEPYMKLNKNFTTLQFQLVIYCLKI